MASPDMIGYPLFILLYHHFLNFFFLLLQSVESSTVERRGDYDRTSKSDFRDGADDGEERVGCSRVAVPRLLRVVDCSFQCHTPLRDCLISSLAPATITGQSAQYLPY